MMASTPATQSSGQKEQVPHSGPDGASTNDDIPQQATEQSHEQPIEWEQDTRNPWNWPRSKKGMQLSMLSFSGFLATLGTAIISPARESLGEEFDVSSTAALLPLAFYVIALGFGPVVGGPLSETVGRYPVYLITLPLGVFFTLGAGFTHNFVALCVLRFLAGFCWAPSLAVASGSISETFRPQSRGVTSAFIILMPFLGTGFGPPIGAYAVVRQGWRWTQWILIFFAVPCIVSALFTHETFHPKIKRAISEKQGMTVADPPSIATRLRTFVFVGLIRPIRMLFFEPIVAFICLYVSIGFGILFGFFAGIPYTFMTVYDFSLEQAGLVFFSIVIGCMLGFFTLAGCDVWLYRKQVAKYSQNSVPPEHRLYPAMIGSIGLPVGLFWFAWTSKAGISWVSPALAIIPFAGGNLCLFISTIQYIQDTYHGNVVASAASANSLARYAFAGTFPLFTPQLLEHIGISWTYSLLGFLSLGLMPIPWILFKYGPRIRAKSKYETVDYN